MSLINYISENAILPISDILLRRNIRTNFEFLMKSQFWSEIELKAYQSEKLKILIKHAYTNVPYYTALFKKNKLIPDDIKSIDDLFKIPILSKDDIRRNFPGNIVANNIQKNEMYLTASSGSTGEPLRYFISKNASTKTYNSGLENSSAITASAGQARLTARQRSACAP